MTEPIMQQRVQWAQKLLPMVTYDGKPLPVTVNNVTLLTAWATAEGGGVGTENVANYNPINTTQPEPGSWSINSVNVQSYPNATEGYEATVTTLENGYYDPILADLAASEPPATTAYAVGLSPWGTNGQLLLECIPEAQTAVAAYFTPEVPMKADFIKASDGNYYALYFYPTEGQMWREVPADVAAQWIANGLICVDDSANLTFPLWGVHKAA